MKQLFFLLVVFLVPLFGKSQYNPQFSQLIKTLEFINPGYNASKDLAGATMLYRNKWAGFEASPQTYAVNLNVPINQWHTGIGLNALNQSHGLTSQSNIDLSACVDVKISSASYLAFGLSGGAGLKRIDMERAIYLDDIPFNSADYNSDNMHAGIGINYFTQNIHLGASMHYSQLESNRYAQNEFYTFYVNGSYLFSLNNKWNLKPSVLYKTQGGYNDFDYGIFVLYKDILWTGISNRVGDAVIFYFDFKVNPFIRIGYSYDYSLHQISDFNYGSHEIRIELSAPRQKKKFERMALNQ